MPLVKGTSSVEDSRAHSKAMRRTKFPASFSKTVTISKVNRAVMAQWIEQRITQSLGFEDEIVQGTAVNLFLPIPPEDAPMTVVEVDPKKAQIDLQGFLGEEEAAKFAKETWELMLDAQDSTMGIPTKLLEEKKKELAQAKQQQQQQLQRNPPAPIIRNEREVVEQRAQPSGDRMTRPVSPHDDTSRMDGSTSRPAVSGRDVHVDNRRDRGQQQDHRNRDTRGSYRRDERSRYSGVHGRDRSDRYSDRAYDRSRWSDSRSDGARDVYDNFGRRRDWGYRGDTVPRSSHSSEDRHEPPDGYDSRRSHRREGTTPSCSRSDSRSKSPPDRRDSSRRHRYSSSSSSSDESHSRSSSPDRA